MIVFSRGGGMDTLSGLDGRGGSKRRMDDLRERERKRQEGEGNTGVTGERLWKGTAKLERDRQTAADV